MSDRTFRIGEVAERVGLSLRTVRYYEEVGLVAPSDRTAGGFRLYTEADIERLIMAKELKPLGFRLDEVRTIVDLTERGEAGVELTTSERHELAQFAARASERYEKLRSQLAAADRITRRVSRTANPTAAVER